MTSSAERTALTWGDVIISAMLIVGGSATWNYADIVVTRMWLNHVPTRDEFLFSDAVRVRELKVENLKAELAATRTKAIEQGFTDEASAAPYRTRVSRLEREIISAEKDALEVRQAALARFDAADFRFTMHRRLVTLPVAIGFAIILFFALRVVSALTSRTAHLNIHWRLVARIAACLVAPIYAFEVAGTFGAVLIGATALLVLVRS